MKIVVTPEPCFKNLSEAGSPQLLARGLSNLDHQSPNRFWLRLKWRPAAATNQHTHEARLSRDFLDGLHGDGCLGPVRALHAQHHRHGSPRSEGRRDCRGTAWGERAGFAENQEDLVGSNGVQMWCVGNGILVRSLLTGTIELL